MGKNFCSDCGIKDVCKVYLNLSEFASIESCKYKATDADTAWAKQAKINRCNEEG